ncbi:MAG: YdeI/OmpD-associated family protein [Acidobacteriota bacterium]
MSEQPIFFASPAEFRAWLESNHDGAEVLWVGYWKVATGKASVTWEESVREALCFGWIDGLRRSIDEASYKIRFTRRKATSHWSQKNLGMVQELIEQGRMQPAGMQAYELRNEGKIARASYEQESAHLPKEYEDRIRSDEKAWRFFEELAPGYTKTSIHWVVSAKREETRRRRLQILIDSCAAGEKIPMLRKYT